MPYLTFYVDVGHLASSSDSTSSSDLGFEVLPQSFTVGDACLLLHVLLKRAILLDEKAFCGITGHYLCARRSGIAVMSSAVTPVTLKG